jgi:GcrA cell cycle regulator
MDWSAEAIERLKALWAEGHSTAEIGRRMGISKNAVVGKAHRLNLPARPSPIRREPGEKPAATAPRAPRIPAPRSTLPQPAVLATPAASSPLAATLAAPPPVALTAPTTVVRAFPRFASKRSCCWPIGEPGTPEFRFCSAEAAGGKPYCLEHAAVAYVKARDRREDAA